MPINSMPYNRTDQEWMGKNEIKRNGEKSKTTPNNQHRENKIRKRVKYSGILSAYMVHWKGG